MVQVIENRTALTVRLLSKDTHPRLAGWDQAGVQVLEARAVPGFADLLSRHVGQRIELAVRTELLADVEPGDTIRLRARVTGPGQVVAESRPAPGDFVVETG
ncbi:hypothetical protein JL475_29745 [Streptomyces sp. M2CJ-2]|uniref:hypothetical protein n=1 Tax=Streptomyces sp. M2CJ-2 TaxID=2803948 RepID=UPI0019259E41|nr:hypothetical protein [Streptomyces sp. M2CJ-2]MBL3670091.1 hypothetical protein [Streptomyces sp. M2CJ-2]